MSGKYTAYPEYKDSGVEWVGSIPKHWSLSKHKYLASFQKGRNPSVISDVEEKGFVRYLSMDYLRGRSNPTFALHEKGCYLSKVDQPLIIWDGSNAGEFVKAKDGLVSSTMSASELIGEIDANYYWYSCLCIEPDMRKFANGMGIPHVDGNELKNSILPKPLFDEQSQIANFLDHETAKIDELIEKQQELIKLLQEKRQAVISHAVTKGLNPDVSMKDSGVEWLGEIPAHWEVKPLKHLCTFKGGGTPTKDNLSYWNNGSIPWVSPKDMKTFRISDAQDKITLTAVKESSTNIIEAGALLMVVRSGILQRMIPIAINIVDVTLNQDMKALRFNRKMDVEFAANIILGNQSSLLLEWSKEGATVESIEHEYLANSMFPVPSLGEQKEIAEFINIKLSQMKKLESKARKAIDLMQERRTALISSAVTGKIDVRHWKAPKGSAKQEVVV